MLGVLFWLSTGALAWVYAGYPALVAAVGRFRPLRLRPTLPMPSVTVAIAVHDEAAQIEARVTDVLAQAGPNARLLEVIVGSDGSDDATESIVAGIAAADPRVRVLSLPRGGQTATQNALFEASRGDVVILTDAETRFAPRCLARLAETFRDPRVTCATGRLEWRAEDATATSANEGAYWRYERAVRAAESRAGFLTAVTGALLAVRRDRFRPVPTTASMDHLLPLRARADGELVVYVADAVATDRPISGLREQFRNRSRTATRGIVANLSMVSALTPWRRPAAAIAMWSHKLLRWATPWLIVLSAGTATVLAAGDEPAFAVVPGATLAGLVLAAGGHTLASAGRRPPRLLAFARAFVVVNAAFAVGWINVLRGRRIEAWHRVEWRARG
jgi:cellulose synthase/poly-beta-1,6-N-acetylglucosamine synthase-like glycosyltransferase